MCFSFRTLHQIYNTPQITIAESQERSFSFPSSVDAEFILSLEDIEQFITILHSTETLLCTAVAWSTSDEGTRHRLEVQRALFAMQASFNAELHNTLRGRDFALLAPFEDRTSVCCRIWQDFDPGVISKSTGRLCKRAAVGAYDFCQPMIKDGPAAALHAVFDVSKPIELLIPGFATEELSGY